MIGDRKMKKIMSLLLMVIALIFISCEDYVTDVDPVIDQVEDDRLNDQSQLPFLIKGVQQRFNTTQDQLMVVADGLSDMFFFSYNVPNATYPTYEDIDNGDIQFDNNSVDGPYSDLGELRFFADDLIRRTNEIGVSDDAIKNEALYTGYLYGGIARYFYATYFGLNLGEGGGGVIDNGPFIPSAQMYADAVDRMKSSLQYTSDELQVRIVNSLIARAYLYNGDYTNAATHAASGMVEGDTPFEAIHSLTETNEYYSQAGAGRSQFVIDNRFVDYVTTDPNEANRIAYAEVLGSDNVTYYSQRKYPAQDSPLPLITWQEVYLMKAELAVRGFGSGDAVALVNAVRASHSIDDLSAVDLDVIYVERDKELFCTGSRMPDQIRFDRWHLPAGSWKYLPITQSERNNNDNF